MPTKHDVDAAIGACRHCLDPNAIPWDYCPALAVVAAAPNFSVGQRVKLHAGDGLVPQPWDLCEGVITSAHVNLKMWYLRDIQHPTRGTFALSLLVTEY